MGFFSSIKRLWSSNKTAETPETPQAPAEEALAAPQPAETEDGASHEEATGRSGNGSARCRTIS